MARQNAHLLAFNRGIISPLALARIDLKRTGLSAETQTNWMPRALGSMMLRPGLGYIGSTASNAQARHLPFVFSHTDTALIELTDQAMRIRISDTILTRPAVTTAVANGTFDTDLSSWTDADETGATSVWTNASMSLVGDGYARAIRTQQVSLGAGNSGTEHALRLVVTKGPVRLRVGSTSGGGEYIAEKELRTGTHSLAFTPTGAFHIWLASALNRSIVVDSCTVESSGAVSIATPWTAALLSDVRFDQSGDVVFVACAGIQPRRIERSGTGRSWSLVKYEPEDGPFLTENVTSNTIRPTALTGTGDITSNANIFTSSHVGALFRISSIGQLTTANLTGAGRYTGWVLNSGSTSARGVSVTITGTWTARVSLQRADTPDGPWIESAAYTSNQAGLAIDDDLDGEDVYYRLGIVSDYTSGTAVATIERTNGSSKTGVARTTSLTTASTMTADILKDMGYIALQSPTWAEGAWSDAQGWPTAVALHEGRLWWAGQDRVWGSVSDAYDSFDEDFEGDAGPISRSIGSGPVDSVNWLVSMPRLVVGTDGREMAARSSSFDEPLTPTNFMLKDFSTFGSAPISPVKIDKRAVYVQNGGARLMEIAWDFDLTDYISTDLTKLVPELGALGIAGVAVQRKPDTRIHVWFDDGTAAVLVYDRAEGVEAWVKIETPGATGLVEDICVLPGTVEDTVYYTVKRTINGGTVRYVEKWALESECAGGTLNKQADSFIAFSQASSSTVGGLSHLEGASVVVWANGKCLDDANGAIATFTVASGAISLTDGGSAYAATTGVVGLAYTASYKSTKLAYAAEAGTPLLQPKQICRLGIVGRNLHHKGVKYGTDADYLDNLPAQELETDVAADTVHSTYDEHSFAFNGTMDTDSRLYLQANAPRPATLLAAVMTIQTNEKL